LEKNLLHHRTLLERQQTLPVLIHKVDLLYLPRLSKQDSLDLEWEIHLSTLTTTMQNHKMLFGLTDTVGSTINYGKKKVCRY